MFSFSLFCDLEERFFENFNISEKNIINVKVAKVGGYSFNLKWSSES